MLFYIGASVANSIVAGDKDSIDCLMRLLDSRKRGLLLLYASRQSVAKMSKYLLQNHYDHENAILMSLAKKFIEKKSLIQEVSRFVYLTIYAKQISLKIERIILISPSVLNNTNMLYPPILLGENLSDCDLYANAIAANFSDGLPRSLKNVRIFDRFEPGGGNSTHTSYRRHKNKNLDFCFCIVDSDRKCPEEDYGDTAKFVISVDKGGPSAVCHHMVIDMYSAENLIPIEELDRQFKIGKSEVQIKEFDRTAAIHKMTSWRYLPLKKGLKGKDLKKNNAAAEFWKTEISKVKIQFPCCPEPECSCSFVPSISDKTLVSALVPENFSWSKGLHDESNSEIKSIYLKISQELRSWLCIGSEIRT